MPEHAAVEREWANCSGIFKAEGAAGVAAFVRGKGRHGEGLRLGA
jgi:hypothetical protein